MRVLKFVRRIPQFNFQNDVELVPLGDMHIGHFGFEESEFKRYIDHVAAKDNSYVALMGDELEAEIPSRSGNWGYEQKYQLDEQLEKLYEMVKPLAYKKKILTKVSSTHTGWTRKLTGHDIDKEIAKELNAEYLGVGGYWKLNTKEKGYTIYQQHGSSSSKYPQFEITKAMDVYPTADVYLLGHIHQLDCHPYTKRAAFSDTEYEKIQWGIRTGAFVKDKIWAHEKLLPKPNIGAPLIHFNSDKYDIKVSMDSI